jgi:acyl carrier protein
MPAICRLQKSSLTYSQPELKVAKRSVGPIAQRGERKQYNSEAVATTSHLQGGRSLISPMATLESSALKGTGMPNDERISKAVLAAVDEVNEQLPKGVQIEKSLDAPLYGAAGKLESLDFVTLIMEVEEKINAEFGTDITIADDNLLSKEKSPFSTLGTLIEYLHELLKEQDA